MFGETYHLSLLSVSCFPEQLPWPGWQARLPWRALSLSSRRSEKKGGRLAEESVGVWLNLTHCSGQWAAYRVYPNIGACFAKAVERRSTLLNQCFPQSGAHARLLCVKPQEAELARNQRRAPLLHTPPPQREKLASLRSQKLLSSCFAAFLKAQVFWSNFPHNCSGSLRRNSISIRGFAALPMTRKKLGGRTALSLSVSKTHPAVCTYLFLLTYFHPKKLGPDLIAARVCLQRFESFSSAVCVSHDLKRNVEIGQIYCSCVTERSQRPKTERFPLASGGI